MTRRLLACVLALSCGCGSKLSGSDGGAGKGGSGGGDGGGGAHDLAMMGPPKLGAPLGTSTDQWAWVDFPDSSCDDGTPTGIGVYASSASNNLLVFLNGGGACWDYQTCYVLNSATHGPFGLTEFEALAPSLGSSGVFNRADPANPYKDWSYIYVPYCTGDLHAGDNVASYTSSGQPSHMYHHAGHTNVVAYLARIAATFPSAPKIVVSGSSAGGYGALLNYDTFRRYWPKTKMYLVDDSGPPISAIPPALTSAFLASWHLDQLYAQLCGPSCNTDMAQMVPALAAAWPNDRLALLSSLQDQTIRSYDMLTAAQFQTALLALASDHLDATAGFHYFFVSGQTHTMLGNPGSFTSLTTPLPAWLAQQVGDDPAWKSTRP